MYIHIYIVPFHWYGFRNSSRLQPGVCLILLILYFVYICALSVCACFVFAYVCVWFCWSCFLVLLNSLPTYLYLWVRICVCIMCVMIVCECVGCVWVCVFGFAGPVFVCIWMNSMATYIHACRSMCMCVCVCVLSVFLCWVCVLSLCAEFVCVCFVILQFLFFCVFEL